MGITRDGVIYEGEKCAVCSKFMHKALFPIWDFYGATDWVCLHHCGLTVEKYDELMKDVPKNFREQATEKQIADFRQLLKEMNCSG